MPKDLEKTWDLFKYLAPQENLCVKPHMEIHENH
jgi:hypothetical protein